MIGAGFALYFSTAASAGEQSRSQPASASDIAFGARDAKVTLIEYSDFQCEFCAQYSSILGTLREKYRDKVLFIYRFFPLANHPYGMASAQAAYAAHLQGRFWEYHDLLYDNQKDWSEASDPYLYFEAYASVLGLDLEQFRTDFQSSETREFILAEQAEGTEAGVTHTPWFVINGSVVTPRTLDKFESLIRAAQ